MSQFNGKVAVVTGAGSGIGREAAQIFAREGASVVVSDVDVEGGNQTVNAIEEAGGKAIFVETDVSDAAACEAMVRRTIETFDRLDYACNNAGIGGEENRIADYSIEGWQRLMGVNLFGVFYCMKYEIPEMLKAGGGAIVNMASILGKVGFAGAPAYVTSKHGVIGLTETAAIEYGGEGIRANAVVPGFIRTPIIAELVEDPEIYEQLVSLHPIGRLGKPEEVAELVVWLCSDKASFVTGAAYPVDGGFLAR